MFLWSVIKVTRAAGQFVCHTPPKTPPSFVSHQDNPPTLSNHRTLSFDLAYSNLRKRYTRTRVVYSYPTPVKTHAFQRPIKCITSSNRAGGGKKKWQKKTQNDTKESPYRPLFCLLFPMCFPSGCTHETRDCNKWLSSLAMKFFRTNIVKNGLTKRGRQENLGGRSNFRWAKRLTDGYNQTHWERLLNFGLLTTLLTPSGPIIFQGSEPPHILIDMYKRRWTWIYEHPGDNLWTLMDKVKLLILVVPS